MKNKFLIFVLFSVFIVLFLNLGLVFAADAFTPDQSASFSSSQRISAQGQYGFQTYYSSSQIKDYWPVLNEENKESCEARQDILLNIAPLGCQPTVVRSDLLAEQNVPVFCQIDALQLNPLLDIKQINNIRFSGKYPEEVAGTGFHPARAALLTRDKLLGDPLINNIGYIVVLLKKQPDESKLPESLEVTLSAQIDYASGNAFGIGRTEFVLKPLNDEEWKSEKNKQGFWNGRYFVRLESVDTNKAVVSLYYGDRKISTTNVERGKQSGTIYMPGMYCQAGVNVLYTGFVGAAETARIEIITGDNLVASDVYKGERFLNDKCTVRNIKVDAGGQTGSLEFSCSGSSEIYTLSKGSKITGNNKDSELKDISLVSGDEDFMASIKEYIAVADDYPAEVSNNAINEYYGESALHEALLLLEKPEVNKLKTKKEVLEKLIDKYPNSIYRNEYESKLQELIDYDLSNTAREVNVLNRASIIRLVSLKGIEENQKSSASFSVLGISNRIENVLEGSEYSLEGNTANGIQKIVVERVIDENTVNTRVVCKDSGTVKGEVRDLVLKLGEEYKEVCNSREKIRLENVDLKKFAKIQLLPWAGGTTTETNLTVRIGIEKRAIQLNPGKTQGKIENLNKSIQKWEAISKSLGNVVSGLKAACFATAAVLNVKNFLSGLDGNALAREQAMTGSNGWSERCKNAIAKGYIDLNGDGNQNSGEEASYSTPTQCFNDQKVKSMIESEINARKEAIKQVNEDIKNVESSPGVSTGDSGLLGSGKIVDTAKARKILYNNLQAQYGNEFESTFGKYSENENDVPFSYNDLREWEMNKILQDKGVGIAGKELENINKRVADQKRIISDINSAKNQQSVDSLALITTNDKAKDVSTSLLKIDGNKIGSFTTIDNPINTQSDGNYAVIINDNSGDGATNKKYVVTGNDNLGVFRPISVYEYRGSSNGQINGVVKVSEDNVALIQGIYSRRNIGIIKSTGDLLGNKFTNDRDKVVRYFVTGPDKDLPALVPFDLNNGWYVRVLSGLTENTRAYDGSGLPKRWRIANVGENGQIDSDDEYQDIDQFNMGSTILGLDVQTSSKLVSDSRRALLDAASQRGKPVIRINNFDLKQGDPVSNYNAVECQEFMSIDDCKLLFNVCDPVICPATRCNFGGKYPVADVIQTGIIGSTLLCLPNAKEGVLIPVCLTGIQAGVDSYVSILRNHRDCLQESLDSGQLVGICDEIYSIYACEFFWNQVAPVANALLPKLVESAYGSSGARGGGEYSTVTTAWDNTKKSVDYFTQSYAVNSLKAFNLRSTGEAGGEFCKAFISARAPNSFKTLIEPDSPPQFYAWFSAETFSDVTVPATSHYKVFYHIFAGNDAGVTYSVYLKNPPQSSYYYQASTIQVASSFISQGQYASETKDFTAPDGYKELCVRINEVERCGFKQVSTDVGINVLRDEFVQNELDNVDIKTEEECKSGSSSIGSLLQPNLQAGAQDVLNPSIGARGIVRICATRDPGASTEPGRYVDVGYCGEQKVRCWLDKNSVSNALTNENLGAKNETLSVLEQRQKELLGDQGLYVSDTQINSILRILSDEVGKLVGDYRNKRQDPGESVKKIKLEIDTAFGVFGEKLIYNHHKAEVALLRARLTGLLGEYRADNLPKEVGVQDEGTQEQSDASSDSVAGQETDLVTQEQISYSTQIYQGAEYLFLGEKRLNIYYKKLDGNIAFYVLPVYQTNGELFGNGAISQPVGVVENGNINLISSIKQADGMKDVIISERVIKKEDVSHLKKIDGKSFDDLVGKKVLEDGSLKEETLPQETTGQADTIPV